MVEVEDIRFDHNLTTTIITTSGLLPPIL